MPRIFKSNAEHGLFREGMIYSPVSGRTNRIPLNVPAGAFIIPADIPSALGQGNSQAGGEILKNMFSSGAMDSRQRAFTLGGHTRRT